MKSADFFTILKVFFIFFLNNCLTIGRICLKFAMHQDQSKPDFFITHLYHKKCVKKKLLDVSAEFSKKIIKKWWFFLNIFFAIAQICLKFSMYQELFKPDFFVTHIYHKICLTKKLFGSKQIFFGQKNEKCKKNPYFSTKIKKKNFGVIAFHFLEFFVFLSALKMFIVTEIKNKT